MAKGEAAAHAWWVMMLQTSCVGIVPASESRWLLQL
jgi:hypothetical protein